MVGLRKDPVFHEIIFRIKHESFKGKLFFVVFTISYCALTADFLSPLQGVFSGFKCVRHVRELPVTWGKWFPWLLLSTTPVIFYHYMRNAGLS